jgi:hypothetical protein
VWDILLSKMIQMDSKGDAGKPVGDKSEFTQFWLDTVDGKRLHALALKLSDI